MANPFKSILNWVSKTFSEDPSKMLIITGVAGWTLSAIAQIGGVLFNQKLSNEQKSFLVPQEVADAMVNIGSYFFITLFSKNLISKMCKTGKIASKNVRKHLNNSPELKSKVGKLDFMLDDVLAKNSTEYKDYKTYKSFATTFATVGAGILSTNIITPIARNKMASDMQKNYIENKRQHNQTFPYSSTMKI